MNASKQDGHASPLADPAAPLQALFQALGSRSAGLSDS
jgi:hypothetical protein